VLNDPARALIDAYRTYGPAFRISVLGKEVVVLAGSEAQQFFLSAGERHFKRHEFFATFSGELGIEEVILGSSGARHAQLRAAMKLGFCREAITPQVPAMAAAARGALASVQPGTRLALMPMLARIAFAQFGVLLTGRPVDRGFQAMELYVQTVMNVASKLWPEALLLRPDYQIAKRRVLAQVRAMVRDRARERHLGEPMTVLDALSAPNGRSGGALDEDDVVGHALFGYVGAVFYMKRVIGFLLYEILKNPDLERQVIAEVDRVHSAGPLTAASLRAMPHLRAALTESLRLYPIQLALPFTVESDFEFEGFDIPAGTTCYVSSVAGHLSDRFYKCPYAFDAQRCAEPRNEHRPRGAFAPFGMGSRVCAAAGLVEAMALTTVASLLHVATLQLTSPDRRFHAVLNPLPGPTSDLRVTVLAMRSAGAPSASTGGDSLQPTLDELPELLPLVDADRLADLLPLVTVRLHASGHVIITEGDDAEEFFVVLDGEVEVLKTRPDGTDMRVGRLGPGDYFGEIGLLKGSKRTATVRTLGAVRTLVMDRPTFLSVVAESDLMSGEVARLVRRRFLVNALLQALPSLEEGAAANLAPEMELARFAPGEIIVRQGDDAEAFYIVARGSVDVVKETADGHRVPVARLSAGEFFGEVGLLQSIPRTATVQAADEDVEIVVIGRAAFHRLVSDTPSALNDIVGTMCQRITRAFDA
jgi:CRP-like cAMP-binding protein/cytochrome P450